MFEDLGGDDPVEGPVGKREVHCVALDGAEQGRRGVELAGLDHGAEGGPHPQDLGVAGVERHDHGSAAGGLVGVPAKPAPEVEHQVPPADAEAVVVDGQHERSSASGRKPPSGRPASTER